MDLYDLSGAHPVPNTNVSNKGADKRGLRTDSLVTSRERRYCHGPGNHGYPTADPVSKVGGFFRPDTTPAPQTSQLSTTEDQKDRTRVAPVRTSTCGTRVGDRPGPV